MADTNNFVQLQKLKLAGSGCTATATSIVLQSMKYPDDTNVTMANFGTTGYITLEPGTTKEENISFTGITQNAAGTATLTGVTRGLDFHTPYTTNTALRQSHAGGAIAVVSNSAPFYNELSAKDNDETVTGVWTFTNPNLPQVDTYSAPTDDEQFATKKYVDDNAAGSVAIDRVVVSGTAGATLVAGDFVYLDSSDSEWKLADASTAGTSENIMLGIAQGTGSDGATISGGVLLSGKDSNQTGLTANNVYYLSDTAGDIATSAGTVEAEVGVAISTTEIYFQPKFQTQLTEDQQDALAGTSGTPSATNKYVTADDDEGSNLPAGSILPYAGATAPTGFFICDGTAKSRTTYATLFAALGETYGVGDGSTTFNIPDFQGKIPVGKDSGTFDTLGATGGEETHTLTEAEMPAHTHTVTGYQNAGGTTRLQKFSSESSSPTNFNTSSTGSGDAHNNLQPYQVINYIIKY